MNALNPRSNIKQGFAIYPLFASDLGIVVP